MLDAVRTPFRHAVTTLLLAAALVGLAAAPAAADPAGPSDYRSEVTGLEPAVDGVEASIRGGDSFLELRVDEGHEVIVEGYNGEPYLRFREDGTVERNRRSPATFLNDDRKAQVTVPDSADAKAEPEWEEIGSGGRYAWHDHRVHWMGEGSPPVDRGQRVGGAYAPWQVPLEVDGTPTEVEGTLTYEHTTSPLPWAALAIGLAAGVAWLGRRRAVLVAGSGLLATAVLAVVVGRADFSSTPDTGGNPLLWILPAVGLVAAAAALVPKLRGAAVVGALASVAALSGWALLRIDVLTKPVLPTDLPFALDRATTAAALGVAVGAAWLAVTSGSLRLPELPDDDE